MRWTASDKVALLNTVLGDQNQRAVYQSSSSVTSAPLPPRSDRLTLQERNILGLAEKIRSLCPIFSSPFEILDHIGDLADDPTVRAEDVIVRIDMEHSTISDPCPEQCSVDDCIEIKTRDGDKLRIRNVRPSTASHPVNALHSAVSDWRKFDDSAYCALTKSDLYLMPVIRKTGGYNLTVVLFTHSNTFYLDQYVRQVPLGSVWLEVDAPGASGSLTDPLLDQVAPRSMSGPKGKRTFTLKLSELKQLSLPLTEGTIVRVQGGNFRPFTAERVIDVNPEPVSKDRFSIPLQVAEDCGAVYFCKKNTDLSASIRLPGGVTIPNRDDRLWQMQLSKVTFVSICLSEILYKFGVALRRATDSSMLYHRLRPHQMASLRAFPNNQTRTPFRLETVSEESCTGRKLIRTEPYPLDPRYRILTDSERAGPKREYALDDCVDVDGTSFRNQRDLYVVNVVRGRRGSYTLSSPVETTPPFPLTESRTYLHDGAGRGEHFLNRSCLTMSCCAPPVPCSAILSTPVVGMVMQGHVLYTPSTSTDPLELTLYRSAFLWSETADPPGVVWGSDDVTVTVLRWERVGERSKVGDEGLVDELNSGAVERVGGRTFVTLSPAQVSRIGIGALPAPGDVVGCNIGDVRRMRLQDPGCVFLLSALPDAGKFDFVHVPRHGFMLNVQVPPGVVPASLYKTCREHAARFRLRDSRYEGVLKSEEADSPVLAQMIEYAQECLGGEGSASRMDALRILVHTGFDVNKVILGDQGAPQGKKCFTPQEAQTLKSLFTCAPSQKSKNAVALYALVKKWFGVQSSSQQDSSEMLIMLLDKMAGSSGQMLSLSLDFPSTLSADLYPTSEYLKELFSARVVDATHHLFGVASVEKARSLDTLATGKVTVGVLMRCEVEDDEYEDIGAIYERNTNRNALSSSPGERLTANTPIGRYFILSLNGVFNHELGGKIDVHVRDLTAPIRVTYALGHVQHVVRYTPIAWVYHRGGGTVEDIYGEKVVTSAGHYISSVWNEHQSMWYITDDTRIHSVPPSQTLRDAMDNYHGGGSTPYICICKIDKSDTCFLEELKPSLVDKLGVDGIHIGEPQPLRNTGVSCFSNALMQCLLSIPEMHSLIAAW
jgi:hypothetical protein